MALSLLVAALAASLTVPVGESRIFRVERGQPVAARKVAADSIPARGEIRITARRMIGTTLTVLNNSATAFTFSASLIAANGKQVAARSCVVPAENRLTMESWPQVAAAVRVADFTPTSAANCR